MYILEAIETTALETQQRVTGINTAMDEAKNSLKPKRPRFTAKI
jgi:hypothetical protein